MTDKRLEGRVAVVTGASRGIGWQAALALASEGAHIVAIAKTVGALEELDDTIKGSGGSATLVPLDLMDFDGIDRLGAAIRLGQCLAHLGASNHQRRWRQSLPDQRPAVLWFCRRLLAAV